MAGILNAHIQVGSTSLHPTGLMVPISCISDLCLVTHHPLNPFYMVQLSINLLAFLNAGQNNLISFLLTDPERNKKARSVVIWLECRGVVSNRIKCKLVLK